MGNPKLTVLKVVGITFILGACTIARPGPSKNELLNVKFDEAEQTQIVFVDKRITSLTAARTGSSFPNELLSASGPSSDVIRPGDTLSLTIFENIEDGVLARGNAGSTNLNSIQVDGAGFIFIPYAGRVRAAGNSPNRLREIITNKLSALTPEPQVVVTRAPGDGATVSVLGDGVATQGVYPIQRSNDTLTELLAVAGGMTAPSEVVRISLLRNHKTGDFWFEDIYKNPRLNFTLRSGDQVLVERDPRTFTILGAIGEQTNQPFQSRQPSALEAVAQVGGLDSERADPTGIFVVREHSAGFVNTLLQRTDIVTEQSVIYVMDLTKPNGIPLARQFDIHDGDTIYVTEAPSIKWRKTFETISAPVSNLLIIDRLTQ
ncbi:polysaccharide biosynthesis/export family protein [Sulfitobacter sp. F26169L]|uniref:polysaccharide biosynthesis/export family protein n=1 Tax=Sulfitobacter sp. F26169L TaxID=2996015 RepID=UPI002260B641|nr:polysaccharide biosynthesis/export family protein [Sulfitobacter sp. F26169L]MCX7567501.1 polysaccharide biosynthesis/export family protein [Sulfitobacter sp. F26169L]